MSFIIPILLSLTSMTAATIIRAAPSVVSQPICYDDFGCYIPRPGFKIYPESPKKINTQFFFYNRNHLTQAKSLTISDLSLVNPNKLTKVIIHGFTDKASSQWVINMTNELLKLEDMNVITVDWSGGNQFPYEKAVANTVIVATVTRQLLQALINKGVKPQKIHLIGHSLGAHVSSYIGRDLPNLGRISGLDPAGPDFYLSENPDRLDSSDALFVDVIHTDGAPRVQSGFGHLESLGHVDFYPNGGSAQPFCPSNTGDVLLHSFWNAISTINIANAINTLSCNHMSAISYYIDSINTRSPTFAYPCSDYKSFVQGLCTSCATSGSQCQQIGYHASSNHTRGTLYLMTLHGIKSPHFGFHFKMTLESDMNNGQQTRGAFKVKFNQQKEETLLFNQNTLIKRDSSNSKTILIAQDPHPLNELSISFQKSYELSFGLGLADQWRFRSVIALDMQSNISYKFCPVSSSSSPIKSGSHLTFYLCV